MITIGTEAQADAYSKKFDNLSEVSHPSVFAKPRFGKLLQKAIDRGTPLKRREVEVVFGKQSWEW